MNTLIPTTLALGAAVVLAASAQTPAPAGGAMSNMSGMSSMKEATVKLGAQNGSGETGTATLKDSDKGLVVTVHLTGGNAAGPQPIHIHKGTCDKLDPKPAYPLTTVKDGMSETTLKDLTVAELEKGQYAINVHHSTSDIPTYVSCGNIVAAK